MPLSCQFTLSVIRPTKCTTLRVRPTKYDTLSLIKIQFTLFELFLFLPSNKSSSGIRDEWITLYQGLALCGLNCNAQIKLDLGLGLLMVKTRLHTLTTNLISNMNAVLWIYQDMRMLITTRKGRGENKTKNANITKLTITRSFHNRFRSGLLYLKAN